MMVRRKKNFFVGTGLPHFPLGGLFPHVPAGLPSLAAMKAAGIGPGSALDSNRNLLSPVFPGFPFPPHSSASTGSPSGGDVSPPSTSISDLVRKMHVFYVRPFDTWGLCYKTDHGRNLQPSDRKYVLKIDNRHIRQKNDGTYGNIVSVGIFL